VDLGELADQSRIVLCFYPGGPNSRVLGLSSEPHEQQRAIAADLRHLLLYDPAACLAVELHLRTFTLDETRWYCRNIVVFARGKAHELPETRGPEGTPARTIAWMRAQGL